MSEQAYPIEVVTWRDAWHSGDGQSAPGDWGDRFHVVTVGAVVRETDAVLSLAMELVPWDDTFRAVSHVPKELIVSRRKVGRMVRDSSTRDEA